MAKIKDAVNTIQVASSTKVNQNAGLRTGIARNTHNDSRKNDLFHLTCWRKKWLKRSGTAV
jgi:hypothetical protein